MSKVWLITGSAQGLGRSIAEAALAAGDRVVATARGKARLDDLLARYGDRVRAIELDVTDAAAAQAAVQAAVAAFGRLDVLVNNAGYGHVGPFEQTAPESFRAQIDTNFYGVVNLSYAAIPVMRQQRSGHIINVSSVGGRIGMAGMAAYQSAKWAVGGFTEVVAQELVPFGVKMVAIEPGGMKTNWGQVARGNLPEILPDYQPSVGALMELLKQVVGNEQGDPARVAQVVLGLAVHDQPPAHLLLGTDALHYFQVTEDARDAAAAKWHAVSVSTDADAKGDIPAFPA
jgi:NAD(P)-dependent dehydrogenase (short-subunit alcohol dehydrogenase family)